MAALGNFLPGTAGSIANTISSLQYALKITQDSSVKNKEINHQIVFLDDLERVDFKKISFNQMLGYFDNLIRQGIKIITICNSEMLLQSYPELQDDFVNFKEKVFDREYKITATHREIILSYFDDDSQIDEDIINEFRDNLRIAQRVSYFYREIKDFLEKKSIDSSKTYSNRELLEYCTYVIVETHTSNYKSFNEDKSGDSVFDSHIFYLEKEDINIEENFKHIYYYKKEKAGYNCIDSKLLTTLLQFYFYRDEEDLLSIFEVNAVDNIFNKRIMLLSDDGKRDLFSKQIKYFLDGKELNNLNLVSIIENWFRFSEFSKILEQEDNIIDSLIKNEGIYGREIDYLIEAYDKPDNNDFNNFISKLENKLNSNKLKDKLALLDKYWKNKDYEMLYKEVYTLSKLNIIFTESTPKRLKPIVENFISQHDYFIDNLMGEIDYNQWDLAFKMIDFAKQYGFEVALKTHIDGLKKNDKSSEMRYQLLIKQLD